MNNYIQVSTPSLAGMSPTKLSLTGNNLIIPARESLISDILAGDGNPLTIFYSVSPPPTSVDMSGANNRKAKSDCLCLYIFTATVKAETSKEDR
jgi:hypothetical protein